MCNSLNGFHPFGFPKHIDIINRTQAASVWGLMDWFLPGCSSSLLHTAGPIPPALLPDWLTSGTEWLAGHTSTGYNFTQIVGLHASQWWNYVTLWLMLCDVSGDCGTGTSQVGSSYQELLAEGGGCTYWLILAISLHRYKNNCFCSIVHVSVSCYMYIYLKRFHTFHYETSGKICVYFNQEIYTRNSYEWVLFSITGSQRWDTCKFISNVKIVIKIIHCFSTQWLRIILENF